MAATTTSIEETRTVNEIVRHFPNTIPVFNEFGIDSCCGGGVALSVAAERDGVALKDLLARLDAAINQR